MTEDISNKLRIGISSRALFDLSESNKVFEEQGLEAYTAHQHAYESDILRPGVAFPLVQKLLRLNQHEDLVEVILMSRNSADTSLRIFNSIAHYEPSLELRLPVALIATNTSKPLICTSSYRLIHKMLPALSMRA